MKIFIDKDGNEINIYAPCAPLGLNEVANAVDPYIQNLMGYSEIDIADPPADYSDDTHVTKVVFAPVYREYPRKPQEEIDHIYDDRARMEAQKYLDETQYLFGMDRYTELKAEEPERERDLWGKRAEARDVIRAYKAKYPAGT